MVAQIAIVVVVVVVVVEDEDEDAIVVERMVEIERVCDAADAVDLTVFDGLEQEKAERQL